MNRLKVAALWTVGKLLAMFVFVATSLLSCGAVFYASSAVFYPEQTDFPNGVPPADFLVVVEKREAPRRDEAFAVMRWDRIGTIVAKNPDTFRLSTKEYSSQGGDPWRFKVIEETPGYQVIELRHQNTRSINTKYRVEGSRITPLSYKTDGGVGLAMLLIPVFLGCLWLGLVVARRFTRWVSPTIEALRGSGNAHQTDWVVEPIKNSRSGPTMEEVNETERLARRESTLAYRLGRWVGRWLHSSGRGK